MVRTQTLALMTPSVCYALRRVCASDADYNGSRIVGLKHQDQCLLLKQWWRPCNGDMAGGRRLGEGFPSWESEEEDVASLATSSTTTEPPDYLRTCDEWSAMVEDSAAKETCRDSLIMNIAPWGWYPIVRREWLAMLQPCCGDAPHACTEDTVNPCGDPTMFKPRAKADNDGNTCAMAAYALSQLGSFDTNEALCLSKVTWGANNGSTVHSFVEGIADPCCEGSSSICSELDLSTDAAASCSMGQFLVLFVLAAASG